MEDRTTNYHSPCVRRGSNHCLSNRLSSPLLIECSSTNGAVLNLKDVRGKAKAYQVRQLLQIVERYNLSLGGEE